MPTRNKFLAVPDAANEQVFLKLAKQIWRTHHSEEMKGPGRPSQSEEDRQAIALIAKSNAGFSSPSYEPWKQSDWVKKIGAKKRLKEPGVRTIKKNLKRYINSTPFPMNLIPPTVIQQKPLEDQLLHWLGDALGRAVAMTTDSVKPGPVAQTVRLSKSIINDTHQQLCRKHILKRQGLTEQHRQTWFNDRWARVQSVPVESRKTNPL